MSIEFENQNISFLAQKLNTSAQELNKFLLEKGIIKKTPVCYVLHEAYKPLNLAEHKLYKVGGKDAYNLQWTPTGQAFVIALYQFQ